MNDNRIDVDKLPGMKQRDFTPCVRCGKGVAHNRDIMFYRIRLESFILDTRAINRQVGLEMSMGAAAPLAQVMGPDDDLAKQCNKLEFLVCLECGNNPDASLGSLQDAAVNRETEEGGK